jgi:hypothetical protein
MLRLFSLIIVAFVMFSTPQDAEAHETRLVCENVKANWVWVPAVTNSRGRIIANGYYKHGWERRCVTVNVHRHSPIRLPRVVIIKRRHHRRHIHHRYRNKPKVRVKFRR